MQALPTMHPVNPYLVFFSKKTQNTEIFLLVNIVICNFAQLFGNLEMTSTRLII